MNIYYQNLHNTQINEIFSKGVYKAERFTVSPGAQTCPIYEDGYCRFDPWFFVSAPAHEHHVIALHKHGHHLGGLPTLFWVSICFLIVTFHLFLFKLIYNEYCGQQQDKYRTRYGKL
jgi:hypothetical protein